MRASDLDPQSPLPLSNLSAVYFECGNYEACIEAASRSLALAKDGDEALKKKLRLRLVQAHILTRSPRKAEELLSALPEEHNALDIHAVVEAALECQKEDRELRSLRLGITHRLPGRKPAL